MTHIEPCPFCGHIGLNFSDGSTYRWGEASCSGCGATCGEVRRKYPDKGEWHQEAIKEWNTRAKREWVGLTHEEVKKIVDLNTEGDYGYGIWCNGRAVARDVEAKLKEKNT
jgi:hypothetical protein